MAHKCRRQGAVVVSLKTFNFIMEVALASILLAGATFWSWMYFSPNYLPPIKYLSIAVLTRTVHPGDEVTIRTTADVRRHCKGRVDRYLVRMAGNDEVLTFNDQQPVTPRPVGESLNVIFKIKLPETIEVGTYIYRAFTHFDCNGDGRDDFIVPVPEASFRVCAVGDSVCGD